MQNDDIYRDLQRHLDKSPVPYPATESGVEIRILKHLFAPEEAAAALWLSAIPEPLDTISRRAGASAGPEGLRALLDRMADKGCIHRMPAGDGPRYAKAPLVVGMYEAQVDRLTPELERDVRRYLEEALGPELSAANRTPQMRTVPVHKSIEVERAVASHDDIRAFVESSPGPFGAQNCICRQGRELTGEPCRQTKVQRNCLLLGPAAKALIARGTAVELTKQQMLDALEQADRDGLVLEPQNTRDPMFVCCCCGCCCGVLTTAKKFEKPADFFQSDYVAVVDRDTCQACGVCSGRCQMEAIGTGDGLPRVVVERCIGCGLCVTTCVSGAMRLEKKDGTKPPPKDTRSLYLTMFQERFGRLGTAGAVAGHLLGRKF